MITGNKNDTSFRKQKIGKTILSDIKHGALKRSLKQDLKDIYHFYLDEDTKTRLNEMGRLKRWIFQVFWLLKSMFFKLTPVRRIMLVLAFILMFSISNGNDNSAQIRVEWFSVGIVILVIILMLELKDKLLATDELMVGRKVQLALMPEKNPTFPGWKIWLYTQPANEVGGDLVDYIEIDSNRLGVALGDVAGKGLGAALFMVKLQATYRAIAHHYGSLAELGTELNKIFCRDGLPNRFASFIYSELQANEGHVRILNAGHMPPLVVSNGNVEELSHGTQALGIMRSSDFLEQQVELKNTDLLFIFSDGLSEARNEEGKFYGEERIQKLLLKYPNATVDELGNYILSEIRNFIGEARLHDDLSFVLMRRVV